MTTERGFTEKWGIVSSNVRRFTKRKQWLGNVEETKEPEPLHRPEEQSRPSEASTEKAANLTITEQLLKSFEDLRIAVVKTMERPAVPRFRDSRCMWCDSAEHVPTGCEELKEALRRDLVYWESGRLHSMDSRKPLRPNYRNGGMNKEVKVTTTPQRNFVVTTGIRVGESSRVKGSF